jgi:hypothetical protein
MSQITINYATAFKPKWIAIYVLALLLIQQQVYGVLTENTTVTADSVYIGSYLGYSNCLSGLVDGKFSPIGYNATTHCCATTSPTTNSVATWLNIDMGAKTVV